MRARAHGHPKQGSFPAPAVMIVMGVSGSGKSTVGALLARRLHWDFEDADWLHPASNVDKMHNGIPLTDDDRRSWLEPVAVWIDNTRPSPEHPLLPSPASQPRPPHSLTPH